jgi:RHS repeat-associated protein
VADLGLFPGGFINQTNTGLTEIDTAVIKSASRLAITDAEVILKKVYTTFLQTPPVLSWKREGDLKNTNHNGENLNIYYFHPDHLGSSSYITNGSGNVIQHMEYLPFGETLVDEHINSFSSPFKFNGKEHDEETGNYYYGARYYDPKLSIFISVDPLVEKTMSSYGYCYNNPVRYTDPTGMESDDIIISGKNAKETFNQLKAASNYELSFDKKSGKVTAGELKKGTTATAADDKLKEAANDKNITVKINSTDSNYNNGNWFVGGAYDGSVENADCSVTASQTVNPTMTEKIDSFYKAPKGSTVMHEVLEAYIGAQDSPGLGAPTFDNTTPEFTAYQSAHNKTKAIDPRYISPNIIQEPNAIYISSFPSPLRLKNWNQNLIINDLSK